MKNSITLFQKNYLNFVLLITFAIQCLFTKINVERRIFIFIIVKGNDAIAKLINF